MSMSRRTIERLVAGVLLGTASCSSVLATEAPTIDACALLDTSDIRSALGIEVEQGSRRDSGIEPNGAYSSSCVWLFKGENDLPHDRNAPLGGRSFVILNAQRWPDDREGPRSFLNAFRDANESGVLPEPVPRQLGDEALWWGDGLAVRRRDVSFGISVFTPRDPSARMKAQPGERETRLAKAILKRLDSGSVRDAKSDLRDD